MSYSWQLFIKIKLTENIRAINDNNFSHLLLRNGEGKEKVYEDNLIKLPFEIIIPYENDNS